MKKEQTREKISVQTSYGKAIIKKIIRDRGYNGDIEKLKTYSNIDRQGKPKKLRIKRTGNESNDVIVYYYKDGTIDLITVSDYVDCVNEDKLNQATHPDLAIKIEKKKREYREPNFIPEVGKMYVGSSYIIDSDCLIIITGKTAKQFKYRPVSYNYTPTRDEHMCGYKKTIEQLTANGYKVSNYFDEGRLKLTVDGYWADGNFSISERNEFTAEGLIEKMSR